MSITAESPTPAAIVGADFLFRPSFGSGVVPQWFAAYTMPRHEKTVAQHLAMREVEAFLPLYKTRRRWKNGCTVDLELPLFPSYIFVRTEPNERVRILSTPGISSLVSAGNKPLPLPEAEIEALRSGIHLHKCEPHAYLNIGEKVLITRGSFAGMQGVLLRTKGAFRVVLSIDSIMRSLAVEVDIDDIEPIRSQS